MVRATIYHILYLSGGTTPHHKRLQPEEKKRSETETKTTKNPWTPSAQSTGYTERSRQSSFLLLPLPVTPGHFVLRRKCTTSNVASARHRKAITCCCSSRMMRTSYRSQRKRSGEGWETNDLQCHGYQHGPDLPLPQASPVGKASASQKRDDLTYNTSQ